ncbi:MAG: RDD family protein [Terriglobales bacterium]
MPAVGTGYGGFWIRVVAAIIDSIILRVVVAPVSIIFGGLGLAGMMSGLPHRGIGLLGGGVTLVALFFGSWLYEALMESSSYQATLGKMIFGMKVTDLYGNRISFGRATGRHFAKILSGMILCIGFIMVGLTERKQGLHDLLAGTLVRRA